MKNNPFEGLRATLGLPPKDSGTSEPPDSGTSEPRDLGTPEPRRAIVRYERSGRGGKEVTVVEQLGLSQADLSAWLKSFKASLGCGGAVEGDTLVLQGDHRKRLPALLTERGARKVTVS
jgi:translation initiation factor 1